MRFEQLEDEQQPYIPSQPSYIKTPPTQYEQNKARFIGTVKWTDPTKRFGYITPTSSKTDIYFKVNGQRIGQKVYYSIRNHGDKKEAVNVK